MGVPSYREAQGSQAPLTGSAANKHAIENSSISTALLWAPLFHYPTTPLPRYHATPLLHYPTTPLPRYPTAPLPCYPAPATPLLRYPATPVPHCPTALLPRSRYPATPLPHYPTTSLLHYSTTSRCMSSTFLLESHTRMPKVFGLLGIFSCSEVSDWWSTDMSFSVLGRQRDRYIICK